MRITTNRVPVSTLRIWLTFPLRDLYKNRQLVVGRGPQFLFCVCDNIVWAVMDSGIDTPSPFQETKNLEPSRSGTATLRAR
jgi:hypothetical protein